MKTLQIIGQDEDALNLALDNKTGRFSIKLSNVGNPDYYQDPKRPLPETMCGFARVDSLADAVKVARLYIRYYELGGGNWSGGQIYCDNVFVGRMSYNGRVWDTERHTNQTKEVLL